MCFGGHGCGVLGNFRVNSNCTVLFLLYHATTQMVLPAPLTLSDAPLPWPQMPSHGQGSLGEFMVCSVFPGCTWKIYRKGQCKWGYEKIASRCTRGGLDWVLGGISSWEGWIGAGTGFPGKWWSHCPWKRIRDMWIWWLAKWFSGGLGSVRLMVRLDYLKDLFLRKWFYETGHSWCFIFWHAVYSVWAAGWSDVDSFLPHEKKVMSRHYPLWKNHLISKFLLNGNTRRNKTWHFLVFLLWQ